MKARDPGVANNVGPPQGERGGLGAEERRRLEEAFLTSSRHEYLFWEAAYRREGWPV